MTFKIPLQEAVAEINFALSPLAEFRAATLYRLIQAEFPEYQKFPFMLIPSEAGGASLPPYSPAYRFFSVDKKKFVQYGPRVLTYHDFFYDGWGNFKSKFSKIFTDASKAGLGGSIERLALTYVDRLPANTPQKLQELLRIDLGIDDSTVPLEFLNKKVSSSETGLSTTIITFLPSDEVNLEQSFGITCTEVVYVSEDFSNFDQTYIDTWFEGAHRRIKSRFWDMLSPQIQKDWKEFYAPQPA